MTDAEQPDDIQRLLARETHLRKALELALEHSADQTTSGATVGALAAYSGRT